MCKIENYIFKFAYGAGLKDATVQQSYSCDIGEKKKLSENVDAVNIIKNYVNSILEGKQTDFYTIANAVLASFNRFEKEHHMPERFTFGNAQKLINITVKFMYITTYANGELKGNFKNCHCPLDRKIGKHVKDEVKKLEKNSLPKEVAEIIQDGSWKKWDSTWSKINIDDYKKFQTMVHYLSKREGIIPIEYDYFHWK